MSLTQVTDATFQEEVLNVKDIPVLVDFWATWCGPCRMLAPIVEAIAQKYAGKLKVCKLDTDNNQATAQNYQITGIPCCIVFKNGQEVDRIIGFKPQSSMEEALKATVTL